MTSFSALQEQHIRKSLWLSVNKEEMNTCSLSERQKDEGLLSLCLSYSLWSVVIVKHVVTEYINNIYFYRHEIWCLNTSQLVRFGHFVTSHPDAQRQPFGIRQV